MVILGKTTGNWNLGPLYFQPDPFDEGKFRYPNQRYLAYLKAM